MQSGRREGEREKKKEKSLNNHSNIIEKMESR